MPQQLFEVTVERVSYRSITLRIPAFTKVDAYEQAHEDARNLDYAEAPEVHCEYIVTALITVLDPEDPEKPTTAE